jgi:hypothetical protein
LKGIVGRWENLLAKRGHSHMQALSILVSKIGFVVVVVTIEDKTWEVPIAVVDIV